ncbi:MAG TPA: ATP-binding protein [Myxococcota bacterium]|nr:ATP-binding protein [Myxococcota bacterium]
MPLARQRVKDTDTSIEGILESILRGAAKILGCISANLVIFNKKEKHARVRVGLIAKKRVELNAIEEVFGSALQSMPFPFESIESSLVYAAWRDHAVYETSSLTELVGTAFSGEVAERVEEMIGEQRFICVPVECGRRNFGVIIFTKEDPGPFGLQRREILLRYAQRIGEIIENEMRGVNASGSFARDGRVRGAAFAQLVFDRDGRLIGHDRREGIEIGGLDSSEEGDNASRQISQRMLQELARMVREFAGGNGMGSQAGAYGGYRIDMCEMELRGDKCVLCALSETSEAQPASQNQLLQFALGDMAPALLLDTDFNITSCNEATERLFGFSADELQQHSVGVLFRDPAEINVVLNQQFLFLSNGYFENLALVRRKNGRVFPGKVETLLLADGKNEVVGYLLLIRDQSNLIGITNTEDPISHLMRRERLATMGEMAAQLAHEIRNPLVSIGATLEMLTREKRQSGGEPVILEALSGEVTRLDMILKDYLSLAVRRNTTVSKVDLAEIISDTLRLLKGTQVCGGVTITSRVNVRLEVVADHDGLRHVLHNLLQNAIEASPADSQIVCHASESSGDVAIHIDDQGAGLKCGPNECFKPFFTTKGNGTGLGLAVCEKIVKAHGGTIELKNLQGGGCRASIVLPRRAS